MNLCEGNNTGATTQCPETKQYQILEKMQFVLNIFLCNSNTMVIHKFSFYLESDFES